MLYAVLMKVGLCLKLLQKVIVGLEVYSLKVPWTFKSTFFTYGFQIISDTLKLSFQHHSGSDKPYHKMD